jgi:hypothetical protein
VAIDKIIIRTRAAIARDQHGKLHQIQELTTFVRNPEAQDRAEEWSATSTSLALGRQPLATQKDGSLKATGTSTILTLVRWGRELTPSELRELPRQMTYGEVLATRTHKFDGLSTTERVLHTLRDGDQEHGDRSALMLAKLIEHLTKTGAVPEGELDKMLLDMAR